MKKKRKNRRKTIDELLGPHYLASHERAQRMLSARIAYHEGKLAEERARSRPAGSA
jgi:hypothetical protein